MSSTTPIESSPAHRWRNLNEAADYTGLSQRTIREYVARGDLPAYRVGKRRIRFDVADLDALFTPVNPYAEVGEAR